jgi:hypothetical protein
MLLASGQLTATFRQPAANHLQECQSCRLRLEEMRRVRAAWTQVSEQGLAAALRTQPGVRGKLATTHVRRPWVPVSAILITAAVIFVILFSSRTVPTVSAHELLAQAVQNEDQFRRPVAFRIDVGGISCGVGRSDNPFVSKQTATRCFRAATLLQETPWGRGNPLSARTFLGWQSSLSQRHDSVTKQPSSWLITTATSIGPVQEARLTLRFADYHPLALYLKSADEQEVTVSEEAESTLFATDTNPPEISKAAPLKPADNPADVLEVQAWQMLRNLHADTGWEANVVREGDNVIVKATAPGEVRRQELASRFYAHPEMRLEMHNYQEASGTGDFLAQRALNGDAPALAQAWLEQQFPDHDSRNRYANHTVELSKIVLGRAFIVDQLQNRRRGLRECSCAPALAKLIHQETSLLTGAQAELRAAIQPLVGSPQHHASTPLTYEDAKRLDTALGSLLIASSSQNPLSYEQSIDLVQRLL